MNAVRTLSVVVVALVAILCGACQSAKVTNARVNHPLGSSNVVWVEPFDMTKTSWVGDQGSHSKDELSSVFVSALVRRLGEIGMDARPAAGATVGAEGIVIRGEVRLVDAGSGAARALVGWGAGQSKFSCATDLFNLAISATTPASSIDVVGGTHGRGGFSVAGYPSATDADDAAAQIADYVKAQRR